MLISSLEAALVAPSEEVLAVENRILAKVNGTPISVFDVMKKLDIQFYRQFPEYATFPQARQQFYQVNWRRVLRDLIDKELVLADAAAVKLPVSNGDIRQELENLFGPNIIANLDKINLPYEEAVEILQGDITLRRMFYLRVNVKSTKQVTPQVVRQAYEAYAQEYVKCPLWTYQVLTIRDPNLEIAAELAKQAHSRIIKDGTPLKDVKNVLELVSPQLFSKKSSFVVSEEMKAERKDLSDAYFEVLSKLTPGSYSGPIEQKSRNQGALFRIFYLKDYDAGEVPPFSEVETKLKEKILDETIARESEAYLNKLREIFCVESPYLDDESFEPFKLVVPGKVNASLSP